MSNKLKIRTLLKRKRPHGRFLYVVIFNNRHRDQWFVSSNAGTIVPIRELLEASATGRFKFKFQINYLKRRVYTHLLLEHPMDVALLKLCFSDKLSRIYKVAVD